MSALRGPSGSGESTPFGAIAGDLALWRGPHSHSSRYPCDGGAGKPYIPIRYACAAVTTRWYPVPIARHIAGACRCHLGDLVNDSIARKRGSQRLSSGEQQRVALPALADAARLVVLDESTPAGSTRSWRPSSTPYWRDAYRRRRSCPSATAPRVKLDQRDLECVRRRSFHIA